ncbi:hypothetical protein ACTMSW_24285 [Micromonospora sp. BQ11]|uniref:hypothetical protein n=1 Tax=Micromonospora sp. BQ11 TaxID=3452212 RepID=UPI003F8BD5B5
MPGRGRLPGGHPGAGAAAGAGARVRHRGAGYLAALDEGYRSLPEFGSFVVVDADTDAAAVRAALDAVLAPTLRGVKKGPLYNARR